MAVHFKLPYITRASVAMLLTILDMRTLVAQEVGFQLPVKSKFSKKLKMQAYFQVLRVYRHTVLSLYYVRIKHHLRIIILSPSAPDKENSSLVQSFSHENAITRMCVLAESRWDHRWYNNQMWPVLKPWPYLKIKPDLISMVCVRGQNTTFL